MTLYEIQPLHSASFSLIKSTHFNSIVAFKCPLSTFKVTALLEATTMACLDNSSSPFPALPDS